MGNNILQPIPATLNGYLAQFGETVLSNTTPAAPGGGTNITWQMDQFGNISAYSEGGGGSGTVTTVSVATANGVSGTVANPTSTPAITLSLGDINPTSIGGITPGNAAFSNIGISNSSYAGIELPGGAGIISSPGDTILYLNGTASSAIRLQFNNGSSGASYVFNPNGVVDLNAVTTATTATAGANGALPATVAGYWSVVISGTTVKIPYYSN